MVRISADPALPGHYALPSRLEAALREPHGLKQRARNLQSEVLESRGEASRAPNPQVFSGGEHLFDLSNWYG
jgi:hypothetical protein